MQTIVLLVLKSMPTDPIHPQAHCTSTINMYRSGGLLLVIVKTNNFSETTYTMTIDAINGGHCPVF